MQALVAATREVLSKTGVSGNDVQAIALDTTGSSVVFVGKNMQPLGEYYLWCDHRAKGEAAEITNAARREGLEAIQWCGGVYSSEWGFSKLLHWLRHNPERYRVRLGLRTLRHGCSHALWHYRSAKSKAQRLRHGTQMAVEPPTGRPSARKFP